MVHCELNGSKGRLRRINAALVILKVCSKNQTGNMMKVPHPKLKACGMMIQVFDRLSIYMHMKAIVIE